MATKVNPAADLIAEHGWQARAIDVDGVSYDAVFFDWYELESKDQVVIDKGKGLPEDERDSYFSHATLWLTDFDEYFAGSSQEAIAAGQFVPIAVLGMSASLDSFAEMNNDGFLAVVLEGENQGAVIRYNQDDDELQVVARSVAELDVQLGRD